MTTTLVDVEKKKQAAQSAKQLAAVEPVRQAKEQGVSLTGPDGLLKQLTKTVLETSLNEEMTEHLGYEKHDAEGSAGAGTGNVRGGTRSKTLLTQNTGQAEIEVADWDPHREELAIWISAQGSHRCPQIPGRGHTRTRT